MGLQNKGAPSGRGADAGRREKRRYHVVRKNKADTKALFRVIVCGYLFYLAWQLVSGGGSDPSFPPLAGWLTGGLFAAAAAGFGVYSWKEYRAALREAELTPEEEAELRQDQEAE